MFKTTLLALMLFLPLGVNAQANPAADLPDTVNPEPSGPQVIVHTSQGDITLGLYAKKSPKSAANFLQYAHERFYAGTIFHRSIAGYLLQGGLYTRDLTAKRTHPAVASEADNGLSNLRGTVAVARGADPNSGTSQFFFNLVDNRRLDFVGNQSGLTWGFTVFAKVTKGMDVIDKIAALPTRPLGPFAGDVPNPLVLITGVDIIGEEQPAAASSGATPAHSSSAGRKPAPAAKTKSKR